MKLTIAAIGTAIVLASSASAMVVKGDNLATEPGGQIFSSNHGAVAERSVGNVANSPAGDFTDSGVITVSVFETDKATSQDFQGGAR